MGFYLYRVNAVELCHALNFREDNLSAIWKPMLLLIYTEHHSRILLK